MKKIDKRGVPVEQIGDAVDQWPGDGLVYKMGTPMTRVASKWRGKPSLIQFSFREISFFS